MDNNNNFSEERYKIHPTAELIKIEKLRKKMLECKKEVDKYYNEIYSQRFNCKHGCSEKYVSYECRIKNNGRCIHYYEIEEKIDYYDENLEDLYNEYYSIKYDYECALYEKENRLESIFL